MTRGAGRWVDAARKITQPDNQRVTRGSMVWTTTTTTQGADKLQLRGEPLRSITGPSVSELLERRGAAIKDNTSAACALADAFGRWDRKAAAKTLMVQTKRAIEASLPPTFSQFGQCIAALTLARSDARAIDDYAAWIITTKPSTTMFGFAMFDPMIAHPSHPAIKRAARRLFGAASPWLPLKGSHTVCWRPG